MTTKNLGTMLGLVCVTLAGCTPQPVVPNPQTIVYKANATKIRNAITRVCDESQLQIEQQTDTSVLCSATADTGAQFVYGYKYGSDVMVKYQFTWFTTGDGGIKINGNPWFESQNVYGMNNRNQAAHLKTWAQGALNTVKERLDGGRK